MPLTAIDLFAGCGGISAGLRAAGFEILAGVDIEPKYLCSFTHNFPDAKSLALDLVALDPKVFMQELKLKRGQLDILAGGPPCQGFSKNVPRKYRFLEDPRNLLVRRFLDYCEALAPRMVLMENVAEMKNGFDQAYSDQIIETLQDEGYTVVHAVLNAADYGVPQRRRRAFFIASRDGIEYRLPPPTHAKPTSSPQTDFLSLPPHVTVWQAIGDLPSLVHGQKLDPTPYASAPFSDYQRYIRTTTEIVRNHVARFLQPTQYARLAALKPGQKHADLPLELQVGGGYSGAYGRLTKDMVAPTITRWVFHPGSGRWGHPVDIRILTIREVARIQSFPDSFDFVGSYLQQAGQLGNAVPPLLAQHIVAEMLRQAGELPRSKRETKSSKAIFLSARGN